MTIDDLQAGDRVAMDGNIIVLNDNKTLDVTMLDAYRDEFIVTAHQDVLAFLEQRSPPDDALIRASILLSAELQQRGKTDSIEKSSTAE